jgi:hypothetical protein
MIRRIRKHTTRIKKMSDVPEFMSMIESVYNTYSKDKVQLAFPAQRLVEKRKNWRRKEKQKQKKRKEA